jgi:hypothetical protein
MRLFWAILVAALTLVHGCGDDGGDSGAAPTNNGGTNNGANNGGTNNGGTNNGGTNNGAPLRRAVVAHSFGVYELDPFEEEEPCVAWTLNNEEALYVEAVTLATEGGFHHSNWFVVPEDKYDGPDGYFDCGDRGFDQLDSAIAGTVLFAQSTQSLEEEQRLGSGVVIKIPPRHKVVAGVHLINFAPRATSTEMRMGLEIIHPADVETVVAPFRLTYYDLEIPARTTSRFTGECDFQAYQAQVLPDMPFDLKLYWVLPHYHNLGTYFSLEVLGGDADGSMIYELEGFNAGANGEAYAPPVDLSGSSGVRFTCGYVNPRDEDVGWGIGDQEMCVMLGFADSPLLFDAVVRTREVLDPEGDIYRVGGECEVIGLPKNEAQSPPSEAEKAADLYVPVSDLPEDQVSPTLDCEDSDPGVAPVAAATLTAVRDQVLLPGCSYSSCHGSGSAGGLRFDVGDLHAVLSGHEVRGNAELPLVDPGNPEGSWLYLKMAYCDPQNAQGATVPHMPINSPILLEDEVVALVREWIANGAQNN